MKSQGSRLLITIVIADVMVLIAILGIRSSNLHRTSSEVLQKTPTPEGAPGLVVSGSVRKADGTGLENVSIYANYASYPGRLIARTDSAGIYQSDFNPIPGDEMVSVWAERSGFLFQPELCYWRHYYGYEARKCDFEVLPAAKIFLPIITRVFK
jgi:hypothetical protein